jgi:hypothetical protein
MSTATNGQMVVHAGERPVLAKASDPTRAFEPRDIDEGYELAKLLVASGLMPRGVQRPEAAFAIIAAGRELGLTAMQSLRSIHIVEGNPTLSADLVAALCKSRSDVCLYFRLVESTDKIATYETHRRGEPAPTSMSFTWEDAQRAGVTGKDNWKKYPAAMLRARCITALARAVYPDLAMGVYDPDEVAPEPVYAGQAEIERPAAPPPAPRSEPRVDSGTFDKLCARLDAAETTQAINAIASATAKAHKAGQITDEQLETLKGAVTKKRALVGGAKPTPPPSAPAQDDGSAYDDAAEAEAEAMASQYDQ